jgi:hypothetical protein
MALGIVSYVTTAGVSVTALIPAIFGVVLALLGWLALNEHYRKHAMHAAVALGLLGFLGTVRGLMALPALLSGAEVQRPAAVVSQAVMAILMAVFVGLGVRSFVEARCARSGRSW